MVYKKILKEFNLEFKCSRNDILLEGSPERCKFRIVLEDTNEELFVLELLKEEQLKRRENIAKILEYLNKKNIEKINPYIKSGNNFIKNNWMIQKYIRNIPLKRPEYINDNWRAEKAIGFIKKLKLENPPYIEKEKFDIKKYIKKIQQTILKNELNISNVTEKYSRFIEKNLVEDLPISFCHGDFHPMNILWGNKDINSVIDWEFCGYKPEIYDVANFLGCIGIENPKYFKSEFTKIIINETKKIVSKKSYENLFKFLLALRFAWLSEWLRKKDSEMINLELEYMRIIYENYIIKNNI